MPPSKVMSKAFRAAFPRLDQLPFAVAVGGFGRVDHPLHLGRRQARNVRRPRHPLLHSEHPTLCCGDMTIQRMDNVLIVVDDLEAAKAFFAELGMELEGASTTSLPACAATVANSSARSRSTRTSTGSASYVAPRASSSDWPSSSAETAMGAAGGSGPVSGSPHQISWRAISHSSLLCAVRHVPPPDNGSRASGPTTEAAPSPPPWPACHRE
jgi:catechol 2,3-dioxygenase-like lactoylglutathione lyase family enzyme